jgi:hypothetical protein
MWNLKLGNADSLIYAEDPRADEWPSEYAPRKETVIVYKNKPSAFFGTPLESFLRYDRVDTVFMMGTADQRLRARRGETMRSRTTFRVTVVEEACGDRSLSAHRANLFDIDMKFGDVEKMDDVLPELERKFGKMRPGARSGVGWRSMPQRFTDPPVQRPVLSYGSAAANMPDESVHRACGRGAGPS